MIYYQSNLEDIDGFLNYIEKKCIAEKMKQYRELVK